MFSIANFYALVMKNSKLENEVNSYKQRVKDQEEYITALKEKVNVLEEANEVKQKLIEECREHISLLKRLTIEKKCNCSDNHECTCNKPLLTKENFVDIVKLIQDGYARRNKLSDALEEVNEGWFICNIGEEWVNTLISLLCFIMGDTVDDKDPREETIIEWWLYSEEPKVLTIVENGESSEVDVTAPEDLYEYLMSR